MDRLVALVQRSAKNRYKNNDDVIDRLSSKYTVISLIVFAVLVSLNQYVRNPITCWAPKQFHGSHTKFTNNYCWVTGTYYLPWREEVLKDQARNKLHHSVSYYQWIPFILLGQALLFYFPSFIWHALNSKSGVDADSILETAHRLERTDSMETRNKIMRMMTKQIDRFLSSRKSFKDPREIKLNSCMSRRGGAYLLALFLVSKVLYIANVIFQLITLSYVLGFKYSTFGIDMMIRYLHPNDWTEEDIVAFPRVTLCDFRIRGQDFHNVQNNTVECVLPVNMVNEKIFVFLWFWMVTVAFLSSLNLFVWMARALYHGDRLKFIQNRLGLNLLTYNDSSMVHSFVDEYLGQDGSLILRLVAHNTNHVTSTEIICDVWNYWKTNCSGTPSTLPISRNLLSEMEMADMKPLKS
uniref:Innexin n=1 Tax=Hirudo verbana TaxID=311461 RepID=H9C4Q6_9ANNE|nr:INX8 [Hirudo verbana]